MSNHALLLDEDFREDCRSAERRDEVETVRCVCGAVVNKDDATRAEEGKMSTPNDTDFSSIAVKGAIERICRADRMTRMGILTPHELFNEINKERGSLGYEPLVDEREWLRRWL